MMPWRCVMRYLWPLPATMIGIIFATMARASGATIRAADGVVEVGGGGVGRAIALLPRALQFNAITFGHVVIGVSHGVLAQCRRHERVHVRQYERWGVLFFPRYVASSVWALLRGRHPYWHNYFERQAYREERRV